MGRDVAAEAAAWEAEGGAVIQEVSSVTAVATAPNQEVVAGELFTVIGDKAVYSLEPGATGHLVLTSDQRFALIAGGHIAPAVQGK